MSASMTRAVPAALITHARPGSSRASRTDATAARWTTASWGSARAARIPAGSVSSKGTSRTAPPQRWFAQRSRLSCGRQAAVTSCPVSTSRCTRHCPTNPSAPVTSTLIREPTSSSPAQPLEVGIDHHRDQLGKAHFRTPPQLAFGLGRIGLQHVHLSRTHVARIAGHVLPPVEPHMAERSLHQVPHAVSLAGSDHVVLGSGLLQHPPHRVHVIPGKAPIAASVEVAERDLLRNAELDARYPVGDLAGDELDASPRRLVVEEYATDCVQVVRLPVVHRDPVAVHLGYAVRR